MLLWLSMASGSEVMFRKKFDNPGLSIEFLRQGFFYMRYNCHLCSSYKSSYYGVFVEVITVINAVVIPVAVMVVITAVISLIITWLL